MTQLRQQMSDAMLVRGFAARTQESYLYAVTALANYYHRPPDTLSLDELQNYFLYLVKERGLSSASRLKRLLLVPLVPQRHPFLLSSRIELVCL